MVADDSHDDEPQDVLHFTRDERVRLLKFLGVVDQLETFTPERKGRLTVLIDDQPVLHAMAENREFWSKVVKFGKRLCLWFIGFVGGLTTLAEFYNVLQKGWHH